MDKRFFSKCSYFNFAGFIATWLLFASLSLASALILYVVTTRGFALADGYRALLIDLIPALPVLFIKRRYLWYVIPVFVVLAAINCLNIFHILSYQSAVSAYAIFAIIETTGAESVEFVTDQLSLFKFAVILFSLILPYWVFVRFVKNNAFNDKKYINVIGGVLFIVALFVVNAAFTQGTKFLSSHPVCVVGNSAVQYSKFSESKAAMVSLDSFGKLHFGEEPQTYIVIVGESCAKNHMGIYGYPRETTPYAETDGWISFKDVVSPATHTLPSLMASLRLDGGEDGTLDGTIVELFKASGFKTFWLSNQTAPKGSGNFLETITSFADERCYINLSRKEGKSASYDTDLLCYLDNALNDPAPKKVIFLHLLGSHMTYSLRYPRDFREFALDSTTGIALKKWHDANAIEHINHFDNSILYNDLFLHSVLGKMKNILGSAFVLYFSDHGQDVYDSRYMHGADANNPSKYMVEIPMYLWCSSKYKVLHPQVVDYLEKNKDKPYSTKTISGTIAKLAGIRSKKIDVLPSFFSDEKNVARIVNKRFNYQDIVVN